ncbi:MAG: protein phosphatase 2C domain-containing protein, partial [Flavisolibacter sp.]
MSDAKHYIKSLFSFKGLPVAANRTALFEKFIAEEVNLQAASQILENQKMLTEKWRIKNRIADIQQQSLSIPNGTVGKAYQAKIDFVFLKWNDIIFSELEGLEEMGLKYDNDQETISGTPSKSGDVKIILKFRIDGEAEDSTLNEKIIPLIINPDPKSLWKTKDSDQNDPYWKEDNVAEFVKLGDRHIVVASKRGRSHANVGSFRDDDYAFKHYDQNGWNIVVVADGAGSAKFSRKGSEIACKAVVEYFDTHLTPEFIKEFDEVLLRHHSDKTDSETGKKLSVLIYETLSKAAYYPHQKL